MKTRTVTTTVRCAKCRKVTLGTWEPGAERICVGCGRPLPPLPRRAERRSDANAEE